VGVVVLTFLDLVTYTVFSVDNVVFVFLFFVVFALEVLTGQSVGFPWTSHTAILATRTNKQIYIRTLPNVILSTINTNQPRDGRYG